MTNFFLNGIGFRSIIAIRVDFDIIGKFGIFRNFVIIPLTITAQIKAIIELITLAIFDA